jgi:ABC-type Fe3+/spermidine/putrescine transport system ATPase subunit
MIFEREYSTAVYLLAPGTEVIGAQLVSLWQGGAIDIVAALSLINIILVGTPRHRAAFRREAAGLNKGDSMAELTVENLHLTYGTNPILKGVSMVLNRGEVVSLLGPSGSGKTTLLRAVGGLETPHKGTIRIGDKVVFDGDKGFEVPAEARNLGLVFQSYALWPHKTVFENVAFGLKLRKVSSDDIASRVKKALDELSLGHLADRYPHQLSGGQQQRVAIARRWSTTRR